MVIKRVLTNNAVIIEVDNQEKICCGKGIAFSKTKGDFVDEKNIDKIFVLENNINSNYENIIQSIPFEYLELSQSLINFAKKELNKNFNDVLILTLADHIHGAVNRLKDPNINKLDNPFLNDLLIFYSKEFNVAKKTNELIKKIEDINFSDNEIGFITLHIINSEKTLFSNNEIINKIVDQVLKIVDLSFNLKLNKKSFDYNRFVTHLKYFALRITKKEQLDINNQKNENELFDFIKTQYESSFKTALKIKKLLLNEYQCEIDNNELTYLTIHIKRLLDTLN